MCAKHHPHQPRDVIAPNSIVASLAETDAQSFFRTFSQMPTFVALGLLALVDRKNPGAEVVVAASRVLDIIRTAARIDDQLATRDAAPAPSRYRSKHFAAVNTALLALHDTILVARTVTYAMTSTGRERIESVWRFHYIDSFRYIYITAAGEEENLDLAAPDAKENVSKSGDRAVYRLKDRRPSRVGFRLNAELAAEIKQRGHRSIFRAEVFSLLRKLIDDPAAMRVALWIIAHRDREIRTNRTWLSEHLVAGAGHRTQDERDHRLDEVLRKVEELGVITGVAARPYAATSAGTGTYLVLHKAPFWHIGGDQEGV